MWLSLSLSFIKRSLELHSDFLVCRVNVAAEQSSEAGHCNVLAEGHRYAVLGQVYLNVVSVLDYINAYIILTDDVSQLSRSCGEESSGAEIRKWVRRFIQLQIDVWLEDWDPPWGHLFLSFSPFRLNAPLAVFGTTHIVLAIPLQRKTIFVRPLHSKIKSLITDHDFCLSFGQSNE